MVKNALARNRTENARFVKAYCGSTKDIRHSNVGHEPYSAFKLHTKLLSNGVADRDTSSDAGDDDESHDEAP